MPNKQLFKAFVLIQFLSIISAQLFSQGIAVGQWRDHLPYVHTKTLTEAGDRIYCASEHGLFYYTKSTTEVEKLSKITGLSDIGFSTINYDTPTNTLVIAYSNTNIDLIQDNQIINIPDIKIKSIPGNKVINKIFFKDNYAYIACGFGIVVLDLIKKEIKDTYYIGPNGTYINVLDITCDENSFFVGTEAGIYSAPLNSPNLANYNFWTRFNTISTTYPFNAIGFHAGKIYANLSTTAGGTMDTVYVYDGTSWSVFNNTLYKDIKSIKVAHDKMVICAFDYPGFIDVYDTAAAMQHHIYKYFGLGDEYANPYEAFADADFNIWIADNEKGLVKNFGLFSYENIHPNGPEYESAFDMSVVNSNLWVAGGGVNSAWGQVDSRSGVYSYINGNWDTKNHYDYMGLDTIRDYIAVAVDPQNPSHIFAGSWGYGVTEFLDGQVVNVYNTLNSQLVGVFGATYIRIGGLAFDDDGNLWVSNAGISKMIAVRKANGQWKNFIPGNISASNTSKIIVDSYNQKWAVLQSGVGVLFFNDNNTIDDLSDDCWKKLNTSAGNGGLPSNYVFSIAEDLDGEIWVGTDKGVAVFYNPGDVCSGANFDAQQILIEQDGYAQYLFETEVVSVIAVDGANRKWIGTQNAGVFLMSPDGTEELLHFTEENSPLFSNNIMSLTVDGVTGEVFIGTQKGIISYKGDATTGDPEFGDVYAYPNPVHHGYDGVIAIKGLVKDADVKITDISGKLIYATKAQGGQATWNGKNFDGEKVHTGVYLVFASNEDGTQTHVTKILVIN